MSEQQPEQKKEEREPRMPVSPTLLASNPTPEANHADPPHIQTSRPAAIYSYTHTSPPLIHKVNKYGGEVKEDVDNWVLHYMDTRQANGWDAMYCMQILPACLIGAASEWWHEEGKAVMNAVVVDGMRDAEVMLKAVLKALVIRFGDPMKKENARTSPHTRPSPHTTHAPQQRETGGGQQRVVDGTHIEEGEEK